MKSNLFYFQIVKKVFMNNINLINLISSSETHHVYSLNRPNENEQSSKDRLHSFTHAVYVSVSVWMYYSKKMNAEKAVLHFWNKFVQSSLFVWMKTLNDFIECVHIPHWHNSISSQDFIFRKRYKCRNSWVTCSLYKNSNWKLLNVIINFSG